MGFEDDAVNWWILTTSWIETKLKPFENHQMNGWTVEKMNEFWIQSFNGKLRGKQWWWMKHQFCFWIDQRFHDLKVDSNNLCDPNIT